MDSEKGRLTTVAGSPLKVPMSSVPPDPRARSKFTCGHGCQPKDAIGPDGSTTELYRQMAAQFGGAGAPFEPMVHRSTLMAFISYSV